MSCSCHHHKGKVRFPVFFAIIILLGALCVVNDLLALDPPVTRLEVPFNATPFPAPKEAAPLFASPQWEGLPDLWLRPPPVFSLYTTYATNVALFPVVPARYIHFACRGGAITLDLDTGKVTWPETLSVDDASVEFWLAVETVYPRLHLHLKAK